MKNKLKKFGSFRDLIDTLPKKRISNSDKFEFTKRVVKSICDLGDKPRIIDYIGFGLQVKSDYDYCFNNIDPFVRFSDKNGWYGLFETSVIDIIYDVIRKNITRKYKSITHDSSAMESFETTIDDVQIGIISSNSRVERIYVKSSQTDEFKKLFKKLFWEMYDLSVNFDLDAEDKLSISNDTDRNKSLMSSLAQRTTDDIGKYLDSGFGRSILFYGPPGSGKSCLVRQVALLLGFKTLRINNICACSSQALIELINLIGAEIIILEDIDSIRLDELSDMLRKIEKMNSSKRVILATVNKVIKLDNALVRPERFDEAIEVNKLDKHIIMSIINNDEEIYEIVKDYPAAFVSEVGKRLKVLGKEKMLSNMADLKDRFSNLNRDCYKLLDEIENE